MQEAQAKLGAAGEAAGAVETQLRTDLEEAKETISALENRLDESRAERDEALSTSSRLEAENASGDEAKAALNQRIEELERTLRGSQEELSEMAEAAETAARQRGSRTSRSRGQGHYRCRSSGTGNAGHRS